MSRPTVAAYQYTRNCRRIAYPFVESIQSALLVADRVFVCDCESSDGTWDVLQALAAADPRVEVMRHPWGDHYRVQGRVCNGLLEAIGTKYDFALQVQADEVVCEWTVEAFREDLRAMLRGGYPLGRPSYVHLCPDYRTQFPFIYRRKAVLSRTAAGTRYDADSDGCSIAGGSVYDTSLELHHVGKVSLGREAAALAKELEFQELYRDLGFPDPKFVAQKGRGVVDYREAFAGVDFTPYHGPWPAALLQRKVRDEGLLGGCQ